MKPTLIMMCGLPGSGKSTLAYELSCTYVCPVFSSDSIRKELTGSESNMEKDNEVFNLIRNRIKKFLENNQGENAFAIYDACNISYKRRMALLNELKKYDFNKVCYFVYTPYEKCIENNNKRSRVVPEYAIRNMYKSFYIPQYYEGWDSIVFYSSKQAIINDDINSNELSELFYNSNNGLCNIEHENPHHTYNIGNHCIACYLNTIDMHRGNMDFNLSMAALLHDIGKPFTKVFVNSKGEESEIAHYYQHHLVSAYQAIPYLRQFSESNMMEILALIQWHMFPYFWEKDNNEKMKSKYKRLWGDELFSKIMKLHEADRKAH